MILIDGNKMRNLKIIFKNDDVGCIAFILFKIIANLTNGCQKQN